jgi:sulfide:quinone oxidoreductase
VAFVIPDTASWSLPLYELAIITARHVAGAGIDDVHLTFVTPEKAPLELFGPEGSRAVAALLAGEGIEFVGSAAAEFAHNAVEVAGRRVDEHCAVSGLDAVYAAGDVTAFPIKQGGLAAQQAVAAAEAIATRHGADLDPQPYRPVPSSVGCS